MNLSRTMQDFSIRFCRAAVSPWVNRAVRKRSASSVSTLNLSPPTNGRNKPMSANMGMARCLEVAIVGAGPSALYAVEALIGQTEVPIRVSVIDRLPVPFGLLRYGVAPDHQNIRAVRKTLEPLLEQSE